MVYLLSRLGIVAQGFVFTVVSVIASASDISSVIISSDIPSKELGQSLFAQKCASCHSFVDDGVGPRLGTVTIDRNVDWLNAFIRNPDGVVKSGDADAVALFKKYKLVMPGFADLSNKEMTAILSYMHANNVQGVVRPAAAKNALIDPIEKRIGFSGINIAATTVAQLPASSSEHPLARVSKVASIPDTSSLFTLDMRGTLYELIGGQAKAFLDLKVKMPNFIDAPGMGSGFGSFAFHPNYEKNGLLYTAHSEKPNSKKADFGYDKSISVSVQWVITEWMTMKPGERPFSGTSREILRVDMPNNVHGIQELAFNPTAQQGDADYGMLYAGVGDGGGAQKGYGSITAPPTSIWGKIIRIDPLGSNSANHKYGIPEDNPVSTKYHSDWLGEVYAMGFRNPHRMSWDRKGRLFVSNIGQHAVESLYLVEMGSNSGWPYREGGFDIDVSKSMYDIFESHRNQKSAHYNDPIARYDHDEGNAIAGGFEYRGKKMPSLYNKFLFGDIVNGRLFEISLSEVRQGSQANISEVMLTIDGQRTTFLSYCKCSKIDLRLGMDSAGELFITTKHDGKIYSLSETFLF